MADGFQGTLWAEKEREISEFILEMKQFAEQTLMISKRIEYHGRCFIIMEIRWLEMY